MSLKKKIFNLAIFFTLVVLASLPVMTISVANAAEISPLAFQEGTSYSNSHNMRDAINFVNNEEELNARYVYYPYATNVPASVTHMLYPRKVAGIVITANIQTQVELSYMKKVWFKDREQTDVTPKTFDNGTLINICNGSGHHVEQYKGPKDKALIRAKSIIVFNDAEFGACTWTITGS